ncbi:hypothetical protein [Crocinitomix catalasitica]|uniref:hypothetical protein n=1 Tax=Crocinitomix catalasitica TaxID=184607 RepID=UPI00047FF3BC|nr:hypothetical protein [Crocinitomix catalasitica]
MNTDNFDTLSTAVDALTKNGFKESFKAEEDCIRALYSKNTYQPNQLTIVNTFRFEGMTNPQDNMELFAIEAEDGLKGTLVMSYSAEHSQNVELIKQIKEK